MVKKKLLSGFELSGISPNMLLKNVESTAPFIFNGEINREGEKCAYLNKLFFYKKNLKQLSNLNLSEYFYLCLSAHWATAGTFVPTDVDNQIRYSLWKHPSIKKNLKQQNICDLKKMAEITIDSWSWDYSQVTNRKSFNNLKQTILSTHEGTWLSVAIGAYCALTKYKQTQLASKIGELILFEIKKEETLLLKLRKKRDHINFLKISPLVAHNLGDLDRVMVQWEMEETNSFCKKIFKLGHKENELYDPIFVYNGKVNKMFCSNENHRHLSLRIPKCLRKSTKFLIPVGPFMDQWASEIGKSDILSNEEKAEIMTALFDGYNRQEEAYGYCRAFGAMNDILPKDFLDNFLPFDLVLRIKQSRFYDLSKISVDEFELAYIDRLNEFSF